MHFSYHPKEIEPKKVAYNWEKFSHPDAFALMQRAIVKKAISGVIWQDGRRLKRNFCYADMMVLDIDDGLTVEQAKEKLEDISHIIATSKSHKKEKGKSGVRDRFRVVIPFENRITKVDDFEATVRKWAKEFDADMSKVNASSYFAPCLEIVSYLPIDRDIYRAEIIKGTPPKKQKIGKPASTPVMAYLERNQKLIHTFITEGKPFGEGRQHSCFITAAKLHELGVSSDEIEKIIKSSPFDQTTSWCEESDLRHAIRSATNRR
jgi:hypothetical protein